MDTAWSQKEEGMIGIFSKVIKIYNKLQKTGCKVTQTKKV